MAFNFLRAGNLIGNRFYLKLLFLAYLLLEMYVMVLSKGSLQKWAKARQLYS
jgi:hypothetical protein